MCSIQSLGLHEPSALPYLIAESILPAEPSPSLYNWAVSQSPGDDGSTLVEDEILFTSSCVVWSRNRIVKRTLKLDVEGEPIRHAFIADFAPSNQGTNARDKDFEHEHRSLVPESGLVVVLKTRAHIFLFSGDTHVLPFSFEVESAFAIPSGFILQRTLSGTEVAGHGSSFLQHDLSTINETLTSLGGTSSRPSIVLPDTKPLGLNTSQPPTTGMPRTFSYTQLMSEIGFVVWSPNRKGQPLAECSALPRTERIIFTSSYDEFGAVQPSPQKLCIAVTVNESNFSITVWHVVPDAFASEKLRNQESQMLRTRHSTRKSSNIYARELGVATSAARVPNTGRESLLVEGQNHAQGLLSMMNESKQFPDNDIASRLGPEFGDLGTQTRSTRRVSSMLARTDLGPANDRTTFHDLALGHAGRQSLNRAGKRGESIGGMSDRQSFGFRRRSSFPTNPSIMSNGTSFLDVSTRALPEDFDTSRQSTPLEDEGFDGRDSKLPRDIGFFRIKTISRSATFERSDVGTDLKVLTLTPPASVGRNSTQNRDLYLCVMDRTSQELTLVQVLVKIQQDLPARSSRPERRIELKATEVRRIPGIKDACKVTDGDIQRLVVLTQSRSEHNALQLEAPWAPSFRVELVTQYAMFGPFHNAQLTSPSNSKDAGAKRTISANDINICGLTEAGIASQFYAIDQKDRQHSIALRLRPSNPLVSKILQMCDLVLTSSRQESLLVAFWEVSRWLKDRVSSAHSEWTALTVVLFSLAVPFLNSQTTTPIHRRKKSAFLRSSSGNAVDLSSYNEMIYEDYDIVSHSSLRGPAWNWVSNKTPVVSPISPRPKNPRATPTLSNDDDTLEKKNAFILRCIALAKDYVQSPMGEAAAGPEGYLPTSVNTNREQRCNAIPSILIGLQLLYEESKLNLNAPSLMNSNKSNLVLIMMQLGQWLGWEDWVYGPDKFFQHEASDADACLFDHSVIDALPVPAQPFPPPSIYDHIERCISGHPSPQFLTLARIAGRGDRFDATDQPWQRTAELTPRTLSLLSLMDKKGTTIGTHDIVDALLGSKSGLGELETLPDGIAAAFHQGLAVTLDHVDKASVVVPKSGLMQLSDSEGVLGLNYAPVLKPIVANHESLKDFHTMCASSSETETNQRWDASSEADRHAITKLLFNEDRRFPEASKLLNQTRAPIVECTPEPEWTEVELLEAQKELAQHVTRRTLSVAAGRGMMHFNARVPLITERVPIPAFSLQCIMKPRNSSENSQAMTFSADKSAFTEEKVCWAFFHNGASMGLMIAADADGIDTSWILYNKPPELTNRHAGFLLALGLNGHLKSLAKWVAFKYLTPKHTMTSVGLLLGLSASFLGTMDTLITRLLSVHVTRLLPVGAAELNLSPLTQTTGIIGIGLLFYNSQHRRMSEVMLSEIENNDPEEGVAADLLLRDEGYRLAAGFSLGLINLGQGKRLHSLHDMRVVERLFSIAVGTKNVDMVHVLDRATAGAVMALAFVFLKTNDSAVAQKVDVPDTLHQFDYVRPDVFLLRTLARHLIMWDSIRPSPDFIRQSLPIPYRRRADLKSTKSLSTEDMPFFNILAGICFAIGLRYAGSMRIDVRDILVQYLDHFLRISRLPARNYDARVTLNSVRNCLDTIALASATVMAGSGDLIIMRRLRALHGRTDKDTPFGSHLAAHMALGTLFLAGGTRTFGTSNLAIASLCIAFYPVFPSDVLDNRGHLQALRHLWVLAVEGRCLVARDLSAGNTVVGGVTGIVHLKTGQTQSMRLPALIPDLDSILSIEVKGEGFWDGKLDLSDNNARKDLQTRVQKDNAINVFLTRRSAYDQPIQDLFAAEIQARSETFGVPNIDPHAALAMNSNVGVSYASSKTSTPLEWLFELEALREYDHAERGLVLGAVPLGGRHLLASTVIDTRLNFEQGILPSHKLLPKMHKNKLWQLRLLFAWLDRWDSEDEEIERVARVRQHELGPQADHPGVARGNDKWFNESGGSWLRREVIERLRYRVWHMTTGGESPVAE